MIMKAAIVFIAGGLMGSGLVALTRSGDQPQSGGAAAPIGAAVASAESHHESNRHGYVQARFAAQRPFATLQPLTRQ